MMGRAKENEIGKDMRDFFFNWQEQVRREQLDIEGEGRGGVG